MDALHLIDLLISGFHPKLTLHNKEFEYDGKNNEHQPHCSVDTSLSISTDIININDIISTINNDEHCIFWYFGAKCLTKECVKFYSSILQTIHSKNAISHLLDLSACKAFQNGDTKCLNNKNRFTSNIQQISNNKIKPIFISEIYHKLSEISISSNKLLYNFFCNQIINREELLYASQEHLKKFNNKSQILFGDVFKPEIFAVLSKLKNFKLCECYSILQYLEILFIIDDVIENEIKRKPNMTALTLHFILPNDEYKYYVNTNNKYKSTEKFKNDINKFLNIKYKNIKMCIDINIHCFMYGDKLVERPYIKGRGWKKSKKCLSASQLFLQKNDNDINEKRAIRKMKRAQEKKPKNKRKQRYYPQQQRPLNISI
eukprot:149849_1